MIAEHREVRVTRRESVKAPFVAPDLSPVRTVDLELDKGQRGWTDHSIKVDAPPTDYHKPRGLALPTDDVKFGEGPRVSRPVSRMKPVVHPTRYLNQGPSARRRARIGK